MHDCNPLLELSPCGAITQPDGRVRWRVWAPSAKSVELVLFERSEQRRSVIMAVEPHGYFTHSEQGVIEGQRYAYRLDGGPERPDPASRWQPDGVHHPSALLQPERFEWSEGAWTGIERERLVFYELHVGTFTPEGTFDAVIPRLGTLAELGVTAIELMPVAQFPGGRGWGYDGVHPFAVENTYGGPHGLKRLIDACHQCGLAVIQDVVYNHLGPEGNYLGEFGPYFTDRYRTPWGKAMNFDGRGSDAVRALVLDNVRHWIRDYHVDGLRLDAVHAIFDFGARHILREIKETADAEGRRIGRPVHVVAESSLNDLRLLDPPDRGGYGLDAQWSDDFHHSVHTVLARENTGYYADFGRPEQIVKALTQTFVLDGCYSVYRGRRHGAPAGEHPGDRFVVNIQTHDQVGNRARGDRYGTLLNRAQQRLAAGLMLLAPHLPLLFMGEEYGETSPFPFFCSFLDPQLVEAVRSGRRADFAAFEWQGDIPDPQAEATFESARISWSWADDPHRAGLRRLYHDLLAARRHWPALRDFRNRSASLLGHSNESVIRLVRGKEQPNGTAALVAYFNLTEHGQPFADSGHGDAMLLLSSELARYDGTRSPGIMPDLLLPFEFQVFGPSSWWTP